MQNHGGYAQDTWSNGFEPEIQLSFNKEYPKAKAYLTLARESDRAFEWLIRQFEDSSERTMIVMFGDHQPQLSTDFYDELYGKESDDRTQEEKNHMYITPYIIWTNYDSDFEEVPITSANYLGSQMLHYAGLELTDYNKFLLQQQSKVPAIGMCGVRMADGSFVPYDELKSNVLMDYKVLQYLRVQDRNESLYNIFRLNTKTE